jgi:Domain of unknown function (DUF4406)/Domain of unknown function (DUF5664)
MGDEVRTFATGAVRSKDADATRYDLITPIGLEEVARTYAEGAAKYGDDNWLKGMPVHDLLNHAIRHIYMFLSGDRSEPHLGHAAWNVLTAIHSYKMWPKINAGHLRGPGCTPPRGEAPDSRVRVYLSGPMTGIDDWNFPAFNQAADNLRRMGYTVSNPAEYGADPAFSWAACLRRDIKDLVDCDVLVQLPGWENSRGANLEGDIASRLGMDIVSYADLAAGAA